MLSPFRNISDAAMSDMIKVIMEHCRAKLFLANHAVDGTVSFDEEKTADGLEGALKKGSGRERLLDADGTEGVVKMAGASDAVK